MHSSCPQVCFHGKHLLWKNTFQSVFHILEGNVSGFRQNLSRTKVRTALDSRFPNRIYAKFFRTLRQILLAGVSELHSKCPQDCFHGKHLFWKNFFPFLFLIFGGLFLGFWQIFPSTVVRTTLASRFLYSTLCQFFPEFTQNFVVRSVRTAL